MTVLLDLIGNIVIREYSGPTHTLQGAAQLTNSVLV